ncbi:MAG TPA: CoA transferase, partial [Alphaproteobacteria bacterium]
FAAIGNDRQFARFTAALGAPALAEDARFRTNADRVINRDALRDALAPLLADKDGVALSEHLLGEGVPAGPVLEIPEVLDHAQVRARDMVVERGAYRGLGTPIKMSRTPGDPRTPPPRLSEHARTVLANAGYSETEIDSLIDHGTVAGARERATP